MPNYCTNVVRAPKEVLDDLFDNGKITFEKLIPMPKALNITESTTIDSAIAYAMNKKEPDEFLKLKMMLESTKDEYYGNLWDKYKRKFTIENIKEIEKSAQRYIPAETERKLGIKTLEQFGNLCLDNISKYGCVSWYDWSCKNWGTKWDAVEGQGTPEDGELTFLTAWSEPIKVIEKLFSKHLNQKIEWEFIGECEEFRGKFYSDGKGNIKKKYEEKAYEEEEEE